MSGEKYGYAQAGTFVRYLPQVWAGCSLGGAFGESFGPVFGYGQMALGQGGQEMRDENYITLKPPEGFCKNRYCPDGPKQHSILVRGYCGPCASIRRPVSDYEPSERMRGDDWNSIAMFEYLNERW